MQITSETVENLVEQFTRLPTIGRKTARRLASYVLKMGRDDVVRLAEALVAAKDLVKQCSVCYNVTDADICPICASEKRDRATICVVEEPTDVMALERTNEFRGVYHVLGGVISPMEGVGPDDLKIRELVARVAETGDAPSVSEVILAVNPNVEGDTTALYISGLLAPFEVKTTRLARGLPVGGDLEYADEATLGRALEERNQL